MDLQEKARKDPRFNQVKKKKTKVQVDSRFSGELRKNKEFSRVSKKDGKGGQKREKNEYKEMYEMTGDDDTYSNYSEESSSGSRISYEDAMVIEQDDNVWDETQLEQVPEIDKETTRLALVNFDWSHLKANDIMMLLNSFKQDVGVIFNVQIYKSAFGKDRLAHELVNGPSNIWIDQNNNQADNQQDDMDVKEKKEKKEKKDKKEKKEKEKEKEKGDKQGREFNDDLWTFRREDEDQGMDMFKLRKYEMERMRYFFAVITLDSKETA